MQAKKASRNSINQKDKKSKFFDTSYMYIVIVYSAVCLISWNIWQLAVSDSQVSEVCVQVATKPVHYSHSEPLQATA